MTVSEEDIIRDQSERSSLQKAIADVETTLHVSTPGTRRILENSLDGMKLRVATLDKKIGEAIKEREVQAQAQAAAVALKAQMEARLSEGEKQTYNGFLKEQFFTRSDFGKLAEFYSHTWDRLSENGKDEMSHRIWEGVRHHEFRFSDLPDPVKEREEKRVYRLLHASTSGDAAQIPENDKTDFSRAYERGNHKEAAKIFDRESFKQNIFLGANSKDINHAVVTANKSVEANDIAATLAAGAGPKQPSQPASTDSLGSLDLASVDLAGIKPADHPLEGSVANLARSRGGNIRES